MTAYHDEHENLLALTDTPTPTGTLVERLRGKGMALTRPTALELEAATALVSLADDLTRANELINAAVDDYNTEKARADSLEAKYQEVVRERDRLEQHVEELQMKVGDDDCACSYDDPGDVCMKHSPMLAKATAQVQSISAKLEEATIELNRTREVCSLVRRQDYFDVPTPVLVEAQIEFATWRALQDLIEEATRRQPETDGALRRARIAAEGQSNG